MPSYLKFVCRALCIKSLKVGVVWIWASSCYAKKWAFFIVIVPWSFCEVFSCWVCRPPFTHNHSTVTFNVNINIIVYISIIYILMNSHFESSLANVEVVCASVKYFVLFFWIASQKCCACQVYYFFPYFWNFWGNII